MYPAVATLARLLGPDFQFVRRRTEARRRLRLSVPFGRPHGRHPLDARCQPAPAGRAAGPASSRPDGQPVGRAGRARNRPDLPGEPMTMNTRVGPARWSLLKRCSLGLAAAPSPCSRLRRLFLSTPVDLYQDMETGKVGDLLTPELADGLLPRRGGRRGSSTGICGSRRTTGEPCPGPWS